MEDIETSSVLHALYKEASTRRRTADAKEVKICDEPAALILYSIAAVVCSKVMSHWSAGRSAGNRVCL